MVNFHGEYHGLVEFHGVLLYIPFDHSHSIIALVASMVAQLCIQSHFLSIQTCHGHTFPKPVLPIWDSAAAMFRAS